MVKVISNNLVSKDLNSELSKVVGQKRKTIYNKIIKSNYKNEKLKALLYR